jgi:hypothetical protein
MSGFIWEKFLISLSSQVGDQFAAAKNMNLKRRKRCSKVLIYVSRKPYINRQKRPTNQFE